MIRARWLRRTLAWQSWKSNVQIYSQFVAAGEIHADLRGHRLAVVRFVFCPDIVGKQCARGAE